MARTGVTQAEVDTAADALLKAGERPTIERVRALLGTGSPNTLVRLVDDWWNRLGPRLTAQEAKLALPEAPSAVVDAASALWMCALDSAQHLAADELSEERARLNGERMAQADEMRQLQEHVATVEAAAADDRSARQRAESREQDQDRIIGQLQEHLAEFRERLAQSETDHEGVNTQLTALRATQLQRDREFQLEASKSAEYVRAVEARSSTEIDRAREEAKTAKRKIAEVEHQWAKAASEAENRLSKARQSQRASESEVIRLKAQLQLMERRMKRMEEYPGLVKTLRAEVKKLRAAKR